MLLLDAIPLDSGKPVVVAVSTPAAQPSSTELYGTVGACSLVVKSVSDVAGVVTNSTKTLNPGEYAREIFLQKHEISLYDSQAVQEEADHSTNTSVVIQPKHGKLVWLGDKGTDINLGAENSYAYEPDEGYTGKDSVTFMTELAGRHIKVIQYINVTNNSIDIENYQKLYDHFCPNSTWQISDEQQVDDLATSARNVLLANASQAFAGFQNLGGSSVGETTGESINAKITLDDNAARNGWFVDYTPWLNLPKSD